MGIQMTITNYINNKNLKIIILTPDTNQKNPIANQIKIYTNIIIFDYILHNMYNRIFTSYKNN